LTRRDLEYEEKFEERSWAGAGAKLSTERDARTWITAARKKKIEALNERLDVPRWIVGCDQPRRD
jgi:hypothetical protein